MKKAHFTVAVILVLLVAPYCGACWSPSLWLDSSFPIPDNEPRYKWSGVDGEWPLKLDAPFEMIHSDGVNTADLNWSANDETDMDFLNSCLDQVTTRLLQYCQPGVIPDVTVERLALTELYCRAVAAGRNGEFCQHWMFLSQCVNQEMDDTFRRRYLVISNKLHVQCWAHRTAQETQRTLNELIVQAKGNHKSGADIQDIFREQIKRDKDILARGLRETQVAYDCLALMNQHSDLEEKDVMKNILVLKDLLRDKESSIAHLTPVVEEYLTTVNKGLGTLHAHTEAYNDVIHASSMEIPNDLTATRESIKRVKLDIDSSYKTVVDYIEEMEALLDVTLKKYEETEQALAMAIKLEGVVSDAMGYMEYYYRVVLSYDQHAIHDVSLHASHLAMSLLIMLYLDTPLTSRIVVPVVTLLNGVCHVGVGSSLAYGTLTLLVTIVIIGDICLRHVFRMLTQMETPRNTPPRSNNDDVFYPAGYPSNPTDVHYPAGYPANPTNVHYPAGYPAYPIAPAFNKQLDNTSGFYPGSPFAPTINLSTSRRWMHQCAATTQKGHRCKMNRRLHSPFCPVHCECMQDPTMRCYGN